MMRVAPSLSSADPHWQMSIFTTADGATLRYGVYQATTEGGCPPRRALVFLNGRGEYLEKYLDLPRDLGIAKDCCFISWDHRGQGASSGPRSHTDHYDTYAQDAALIIKHVLPPATPYIIVAHSMGALIALYATMSGRLNPDHLILSSPLLGLPQQPVAPWLARLLSALAVGVGQGRRHINKKVHPSPDFASNQLTHSEEKFAKMLASPYPGSSATFGWVHATLAAMNKVFAPRTMASLQMPITLLLASDETVVDNAKTYAWLALAKVYCLGPVHHYVIASAKHELFAERPAAYQESLALIRQVLAEWQAEG